MNWSAAPVALVPPPAQTVTSTVAAPSAGEVAVMDVALLTVKLVAGLPDPKLTAVAPVKLVPVIVTLVPPVVGPSAGLTAVTVGGGRTKVNWSAAPVALVPPPVTTVTSTMPAPSAGEVAVMDLALLTVKLVAGLPDPKLTAVAPVKLVPVMVTRGAPRGRPEVGAHRGDGGRADDVGELVSGAGGARAPAGHDGHVDDAGPLRRGGGGDGPGVVDGEARGGVARPEVDGGDPGEVGAGDGDGGAPAGRPGVGAHRGDRGRG